MYREPATRAGSNILLIFRYVSQTGGASFSPPLSATPDVAEQFEIRGHILTGVRGEGSRVERVFFRGGGDNIGLPASNSEELWAPELSSAFRTAKMTSHYRHTDDSMD